MQAGGPFAATNNCGNSLGGHLSCSIVVTFGPVSEGLSTGTLTVSDAQRTQVVALSGQGALSSTASVSPISLDFGPYALNGSPPVQVVTLNNPGTVPLTGLTPSISGADFSIASSTCGSTLAAASSCLLSILFTPSATGSREGVLSLTGAAAEPISVDLSGAGEDFALAVSGASTAVITSGQTATYSILATPLGTSAGTLTLACTGAPANAICSTSPSTISLSGGTAGEITVRVQTGVAATTTLLRRLPGIPWAAGAAFALMLPVCFFGGSRRRGLLLVPAAVLLLGSSIACGVHSSGVGTSGQTTGGAYTLTITASFPGAQRTTSVQLTVQ